MKIILTTESGADLSQALAEQYQIHVVPMHIIMDGIDYLDGVLPVQEIFDYHDRTKGLPSTTATNPHEYTELFTTVRAAHPEAAIVHIGYTSRASSSFQNAQIAAAAFDNIYLLDALNVTGGLGAIVLDAARLLAAEPDIAVADLIAHIETIIPKARLAFVPGSLDFLRAGGRVSNVAYLGGLLLKIKPRIELIAGKLVSTKKYRGRMLDVARRLFEDYLVDYEIDREQIYLIYSLGLAERIKEEMEKVALKEGFTNVTWLEAGAMISSHAGSGGFGVAGLEV